MKITRSLVFEIQIRRLSKVTTKKIIIFSFEVKCPSKNDRNADEHYRINVHRSEEYLPKNQAYILNSSQYPYM